MFSRNPHTLGGRRKTTGLPCLNLTRTGWPGAKKKSGPDWRMWPNVPEEQEPPVTQCPGQVDGPTWGNAVRLVEAALLLARQPLSAKKIAQLCGFQSTSEVRGYLRRLKRLYDEVGSAFNVVEVAGGYQLRTRPPFFHWISRLVPCPEQVKLSPPALETLAVIAYRQPVLRAEIESIRGVQCGEILRQLIDRGLVKTVGRSDDLGRPFLYGTTDFFLEVFGLRGLDELPHAEYRKPSNVATGKSGTASPSTLTESGK